ncbi:MAG: hypothetical protein KDA68_13245 [Planctomycetaceae bacterium]|nr:hypothetical protein [Planctomycetaceae bacterium]
MEGLPRTPILFSLRRVTSNSELDQQVPRPKLPSAFRQLSPEPIPSAPLKPLVLPGIRRESRIRRETGLARWRRRAFRLIRKVRGLHRYGKPILTAALVVLVAGGGYFFGKRIVDKFSMRHEIVVSSPSVTEAPLVAPPRLNRSSRPLAARSVVTARNVTPEGFAEPEQPTQIDEGPILKLSSEGPPEAYRRQVRHAYAESTDQTSVSVLTPPGIHPNELVIQPSPGRIERIATESSTPQEYIIHVTPGPSDR